MRLSAMRRARIWAGERSPQTITGTSASSRRRAAKRRPWPAMTLPFALTRMGILKPNSVMLAAILSTESSPWMRGLRL